MIISNLNPTVRPASELEPFEKAYSVRSSRPRAVLPSLSPSLNFQFARLIPQIRHKVPVRDSSAHGTAAIHANSLCRGQRKRTMRETDVQIGNSGLALNFGNYFTWKRQRSGEAMNKVNVGIIGTGWCGGIRAEAC